MNNELIAVLVILGVCVIAIFGIIWVKQQATSDNSKSSSSQDPYGGGGEVDGTD